MSNDNHQLAADSTSTLLAGNAIYRGKGFQTANKGRITGTVYSDVAGTLTIQQSPDGLNWDQVAASIAVAAATVNAGFSVEVLAPWARLVYTNGASAQAEFRLFAYTRLYAG